MREKTEAIQEEKLPTWSKITALIAPVVNYWLPGFPANLSKEAYYEQFSQDQWAIRVAHYVPWLTYWWNTQKWFPSSSVISGKPKLSPQDIKLITSLLHRREKPKENPKQQEEFESVHRDLMVAFGSWEFDPMDLGNPFVDNEGSIHLWHGDEDGLVPVFVATLHCQEAFLDSLP
ncbi:uncharacterized protein LOC130760492 [Actinidia eriantha]|uniref:uncharacterized protein LOC130760492 n=1 Tax=Actinidia eriantha TaxID=165200 RepID=UPI00259030B7|nr:uncharacterized protein LOC130760492 [Actinidia eriantha]